MNHTDTQPNGRETKRHTAPVPIERRCTHHTPGGTPCRAARRRDSEFCVFHDHKFQEERAARRVQKDILTSRLRADTAEGVQNLLIRTAEALGKKEITPQEANSLGYIAQVMITNLDRVQRGRRDVNLKEDASETMARLVVSARLDQIEDEIKEAGGDGVPVTTAELVRSALKKPTHDPE